MPELITKATPEQTPKSSVIKETTAFFNRAEIPPPVRLTQYDNLPYIAVHLVEGDKDYTVPDGAAVNIRMKKPDGTIVYNPAFGLSADRHTAYIETTTQMTVCPGHVSPILEVVVNSEQAGTAYLHFEIERNPVQEDDIESTDEGKTITQLVQAAQDAADAAASSASAAKTSETNAANSASAATSKASAAATSATNAENSASTATSKASAAATSATQAAGSASNAAGSAQQAAQSAADAQEYAEQAQQVSQGAVGYYETAAALRAAHPTGQAGNWAIVGETDTIWIWDTETNSWLDTSQNVNWPNYYTKPQADARLAPLNKVRVGQVAVPASAWTGSETNYPAAITLPGMTAALNAVACTLGSSYVGTDAAEQAMAQWDYLETGANTVTFHAAVKPTANFGVVLTTVS